MRSLVALALASCFLIACGGTTEQQLANARSSGDVGASDVVVDESKLGEPCTNTTDCRGAQEAGCVAFPQPHGYRCTTSHPCEAITCPPDLRCTAFLTEPGSVGCVR